MLDNASLAIDGRFRTALQRSLIRDHRALIMVDGVVLVLMTTLFMSSRQIRVASLRPWPCSDWLMLTLLPPALTWTIAASPGRREGSQFRTGAGSCCESRV